MEKKVKVGVGVLAYDKEGKILLMRRAGVYGKDRWAPPGGHVEFGETAIETARRETKEETGIDLTNIEVLGITEDINEAESNHYVTIWVKGDQSGGELKKSDREFSEIGLFGFNNLPGPLFISFKNFIGGKLLPRAVRP